MNPKLNRPNKSQRKSINLKSSDNSTSPINQSQSNERITLRVNPLQDGNASITSGIYSPLFLNAIDLQVTGATGTYAENYFSQNVYSIYQKYLQRNIAFKYTLKYEDLKSAITAVSLALQLYYQSSAILSFNSSSGSKNSGMRYLYDLHTPEILVAHKELGEYLDKLFMPPNLHDLIYWLYDTYAFNSLPGSPVFRNTFRSSLMNVNTRDKIDGKLSKSLFNLVKINLVDYSEALSVLELMKPEWKINIKEYNGIPKVDSDFEDYWTNTSLNYISSSGTPAPVVNHIPSVPGFDTSFPYYMNANNVSIKALALFNLRITSKPYPGWISSTQLITGSVTDKTTRLHFLEKKLVETENNYFNSESGCFYCSESDLLIGKSEAYHASKDTQISVGNTMAGMEGISNVFGNWLYGLDSLN